MFLSYVFSSCDIMFVRFMWRKAIWWWGREDKFELLTCHQYSDESPTWSYVLLYFSSADFYFFISLLFVLLLSAPLPVLLSIRIIYRLILVTLRGYYSVLSGFFSCLCEILEYPPFAPSIQRERIVISFITLGTRREI